MSEQLFVKRGRRYVPWGHAKPWHDMMRAAVLRHVEVIERWLRTGIPAGPEESRSIYEQLCAALGREPVSVEQALSDADLADCGLLSELDHP